MRPKNINISYLSGWVDRYIMCISILCKGKTPNKDLIKNYLTEEGNESVIELQEFLVNNCSLPWIKGINVLEAIDIIVENRD